MSLLSSGRPALPLARARAFPLGAACLAVVIGFLGFALVRRNAAMVDEVPHHEQIVRFAQGHFEQHPAVTNIPAYHALLAAGGRLLASDSVATMRGLSLILALGNLLVAYAIYRTLDSDGALIGTAQLFFLPVLFPLLFLVYTDAAGLLFLLLSLLLALHDRPRAAALTGFAAVMLRQTHVVWMPLIYLLPYLREQAFHRQTKPMLAHLRRGWLFLAGGVAFVTFVFVNGGVALGDRASHPAFKVTPDNVFLALLVCWLVFLPLHIDNVPRVVTLIRRRPGVLLLLASVFALYWLTLRLDHPNNRVRGWFLHNEIVYWWRTYPVRKALCFLAMAGALLSLAVTPMKERRFLLVYPIAILSLIPSWLVEPRYALPALALFHLLRERRSAILEGLILGWCAALSIALLVGMAGMKCWL